MLIDNIGALQGLYVALGGELSDVANITTIPEMLQAISTVASAAASELPIVTGADNGKALRVVEGKWAKADLPADELPAVTSEDNGKVLKVVEGEWGAASLPAIPTYTKTVLFTGPAIETVTLSDSYKNYDALLFVVADIDGETGDPLYIYSPYIPTDSDVGAHYKIPYAVIASSLYYSEFTILSETSIYWAPAVDEKLYKVVGIKF